MMKVVVLTPPMYPVNHEFYNLLGKECELVVYQFGEHPQHHTHWTSEAIRKDKLTYQLKIYGKGAVSLKTQLNPTAFLDLRKEKADIVLSIAFWIPSLYASFLRKILGFKFIVLTDMIAATENKLSTPKRIIRKLISKRTNLFIADSNLTAEYLSSLYPNTKIALLLQTINVKKWREELNRLADKTSLRKELNLSQEKKIVLGVGNFIELKNWEAIFNKVKKIDNVLFVLIGGGFLGTSYKEYIERNKLDELVCLVSRKDGIELKKYYKVADVFVFPSLQDTFGFVVPEALVSGLPVVCSKFAGASCLIENGINGFVVNPNIDFTKEINEVLKNLSFYQQNAASSMEKLTLENRVSEFVQLFKEVL